MGDEMLKVLFTDTELCQIILKFIKTKPKFNFKKPDKSIRGYVKVTIIQGKMKMKIKLRKENNKLWFSHTDVVSNFEHHLKYKSPSYCYFSSISFM